MNSNLEMEFIEISLIRAGSKSGKIQVKLSIPDSLKIFNGNNAEQGFGCFRFMTPKDGDKRIVWDSRNLIQINEAKAMFDEAVIQGLVPYLVGTNGRASSEIMPEFDPYAEEIIFLPIDMVAGG